MPSRFARWRGPALVAAAVVALVGPWLAQVASQGLPRRAEQILLLLGLGALCWRLGKELGRAWRAADGERRRTARWLAGLVALALAVRFVGLSHEALGRYYLDEGTYYHHAAKINAGEPFRPSFVYPHFLYYSGAWVLWLVDLVPGWKAFSTWLLGSPDPLGAAWLAIRGINAALGALVVLPVFFLGRRLGGSLGAGALAAGFAIASPLLNEFSHLIISDLPGAVFAAVAAALAAAALDRERTSLYAGAGVAAGLAAVSKYPAGVAAAAIVATWLVARWRHRSWNWGLFLAGASALAAFLFFLPSLFVFPSLAFTGERGMFFGARQYSKGGWIGVQPASNGGFYLSELAGDLAWPAVALGLLGLGWALAKPLRSGDRVRLTAFIAFPLVYFLLIGAMNMVVRRNALPLVPLAAVLAAVGVARLATVAPFTRLGRWALPALAAVVLAGPAWATVRQAVGFARPSTRDLAQAWIQTHVPAGSTVVKESYTPELDPAVYRLVKGRFVARMTLEELRSPENDVVVLADTAFQRFLSGDQAREEHHEEFGRRYREILGTFPELARFEPTPWRRGPTILVLGVPRPAAPTP
ncbi:MAG: glycosyltransferase family 39 protein [Thermoanaerobaculia bacterium]|nr:glycosyltransferase family 39 protein [Thermoanaerobaculia bacterium]